MEPRPGFEPGTSSLPYIRGAELLRLTLKAIVASDEGLPEAKIYEYFKVAEKDLRFVLDYLEYKGFSRHDTMSKWFAAPDLAKDPTFSIVIIFRYKNRAEIISALAGIFSFRRQYKPRHLRPALLICNQRNRLDLMSRLQSIARKRAFRQRL